MGRAVDVVLFWVTAILAVPFFALGLVASTAVHGTLVGWHYLREIIDRPK